jgi:prephenate dehydratase
VHVHDTAGAARQVAEARAPGVAAVASAAAARRYGLEVLAEGIQDGEVNRTRFLVVNRGEPARPATSGRLGYKASLAFVTGHVPGSLVRSLYCFSSRDVNLTRLDSRPVPERPFEYRFYADFEVSDPNAAEAALEDLESHAAEVRLFGTYPAFVG